MIGPRGRPAAAFKALADLTRLEILRLVGAQAGPVCVCDILDRVDPAQPMISHDLKILCDTGRLRTSKIVIWAFCELEPEATDLLVEAFDLLAGKPVRGIRA